MSNEDERAAVSRQWADDWDSDEDSIYDEPEELDSRLLAALERNLSPRQAARCIYLALLFREMDPDQWDPLYHNDPGHRWFMHCLSAVARRAEGDAGMRAADHRAGLLAARADDPLAQDQDHADWHDQEVVDVEVLRGNARD